MAEVAVPVLILVFAATVYSEAQTPRNGKIAFASDRDGNREIYVMNPDGTNQVRLTTNSTVDDHPMWSPDGTKIAFVSESANGACGIALMNADGTNKIEVTSLNDSCSDQTGASWSPDGNRLAFGDSNDIYVVNTDGSGRQNLTSDNALADKWPAWSPDGSRILFARWRDLSPSLYTIKPDGSDPMALPVYLTQASWSPDGGKISYVIDQTDDCFSLQTVFVANSDGTDTQSFHGGQCAPFTYSTPRWSPDNSKIIFSVHDTKNNDSVITVKNIDDTGITYLTSGGERNLHASWQSLPARVSISGRVVTPLRRGLAGATVTLTDDFGNAISVKTNRVGFYQFTNVSPGTYELTAFFRRFHFSPQEVVVVGEVTDMNFVLP